MAISASRISGPDQAPDSFFETNDGAGAQQKHARTAVSATHKNSSRERNRGEGNIYQRNNVWWIRYSFRGKTHRESSGSTKREDALKLLNRKTKEIWADRQGLSAFNPKAEKVYIDQLLDALEKEYKLGGGRALRQFKTHLQPIREYFGDMRAVNVTTEHVDDYIDRRLEIDKRAPGTINRETQLLGQAFKLGIQRREITTAPHIRRLAENNIRQGFFEPGEFNAVVAALPEYLKDFTRFAYLCAWRKGQIASLTWADVDREAGVIIARAEHVKNGRAHKIVLEGDLQEMIERRWAAREYATASGPALSKYVFHRNGQPIRDPRRAWAAACKAAGVAGRLFHDLRRSSVRNMMRAGVRETVAMAISGHRTRAIFDRYNITSDEDLREAVRQTQQHLNTQPTTRNVVPISKKK
jgi:integrase